MLKQTGYKFILGGRIKKESKSVQDWLLSLEKDLHMLNETLVNGDERIIVSYSEQRAAKDRHNRDKGIQRLRKAYSSGKIKKQNVNQRGYNKFLVIENDVMVSIDEAKISADAQWDGLKSYITNTDLPASEVIGQYHGFGSWNVPSESPRAHLKPDRYSISPSDVSKHTSASASLPTNFTRNSNAYSGCPASDSV